MTGAMRRTHRSPRPLDESQLREVALVYVGRFATTRTRLERYLARKITQRGWDASDERAAVERIVGELVALGYVDDAAFAGMTARALSRRGYGGRRVDQSLWAAGVGEEDRAEAQGIIADARVESALKLAQRRRWGPFAAQPESDPRQRERQVAAFIRAGHDVGLARRILALAPGADIGELVDEWQ